MRVKIRRVRELNEEITKIEKEQISPLVDERTKILNSMTLEELRKCSDDSFEPLEPKEEEE